MRPSAPCSSHSTNRGEETAPVPGALGATDPDAADAEVAETAEEEEEAVPEADEEEEATRGRLCGREGAPAVFCDIVGQWR